MAEKILLVDDVNMFLELEKGYLQHSAVRVLTARDGQEALNLCRQEQPGLVFMDLHMPVMNGADCCHKIKEDRNLKETAVVLITSEGKADDRKLCMDAGCDDFMTKPLDRLLFLATARRFLPEIERRDKRVPCNIKAKFRAFGVTLSGTLADISRHGAYISSDIDAEIGRMIDLVFALPDPIGTVIQAKGKIAWTNTAKRRVKPVLPIGFGVEIISIPKEAEADLARFLTQHS
ncbi:response regulator [Geomonas sp. Red32]|uniref:response regulator n=1 Tax=Geomonas sp. Red32 TaxID=2912856 RepID=UPI00202CD268|nr:response regulator [Geomonas sp. Red32]MCM0084437.1 response regulator [Geomonas sp. Red32]